MDRDITKVCVLDPVDVRRAFRKPNKKGVFVKVLVQIKGVLVCKVNARLNVTGRKDSA